MANDAQLSQIVSTGPAVSCGNGEAIALAELLPVSGPAFRRTIVQACTEGARLSALCVLPGQPPSLLALLTRDGRGEMALVRTLWPEGDQLPSLSAELPQAQAFERELAEQHGLTFPGHPWPKPLRRHADLESVPAGEDPHPFYRVEGAGLHEVAVGPVHAGIIEPGHFRFQCQGESVLHLEIQLGYQHRGAEALMLSSPARRMSIAETLAGDTSIGHGIAHCMVMEALADTRAPSRAQGIRAIALELERLANHVGDMGALCNDVGYLPSSSWLGRLRGEFLNLSLEICGSRFGRNLLMPGGVRFDLPDDRAKFLRRLDVAAAEVSRVVGLMLGTPSVVSRFEGTGVVQREVAQALGLVGPAARASGCDRDVRRDHPFATFRRAPVQVATAATGDVMARAQIRAHEIEQSVDFVRTQTSNLAASALMTPMRAVRPQHLAVALTEGWRGEIVHLGATDSTGKLCAYKIVDPSFHNWMGLAMALRGNQISDFPLTNKSFNLSYAGHDL